jgi:hypothetical protein
MVLSRVDFGAKLSLYFKTMPAHSERWQEIVGENLNRRGSGLTEK